MEDWLNYKGIGPVHGIKTVHNMADVIYYDSLKFILNSRNNHPRLKNNLFLYCLEEYDFTIMLLELPGWADFAATLLSLSRLLL